MEQFNHHTSRLHYDLRLELDPETQYISVNGSMVYHATQHQTERVRFYLHHQFNIESLSGRRVLGYHLERIPAEALPGFLSEAAQLDIYFDPPLSAGDTALVQFDYHGNITEWAPGALNQISQDWVELGMYLPWYPLLQDGTASNLTFTLQASCPSGCQVASLGSSAHQGGISYFNWSHPTDDIVVVASPSLQSHVFESEANRVLLHRVSFSSAAAQQIGEELLWTLERFAGWFGPIRPSEFTLIEAPRALGGGYARRGLVVLAGVDENEYFNQRESYLHDLAHEAAHAWWSGAPSHSWESWLNESFSEYSALMVIRERYGQEAFDRHLERKREQVVGINPLWEFDQTDINPVEKQHQTENHLYHQGPLLLHNLAERIGYRRFLDLCRAMQWGGVHDTAHFLDLLEELENKSSRDWMEATLKQQQ